MLALCGGCAVWKCLCFFTITIISVYNEQIYNLASTGSQDNHMDSEIAGKNKIIKYIKILYPYRNISHYFSGK